MSQYDLIYKNQVENIIANGISDENETVRTKWADGTSAHTLSAISEKIVFDGSEVPYLTTKQFGYKWPIHELLWFYVKRTSDASYLKEHKVTIWDEWIRKDGTIGKAYGYQLGKDIRYGKMVEKNGGFGWMIDNQVNILLNGLKKDHASRRHIISLWNIDDLHDMALYPCVWNSQWLVKQGKLHGIVQIRSNDVALGQPYNCFQYYVLQRMLAQVTGWAVGTLTFNIGDCHIYTRHIDTIKEQIVQEQNPAPKLWINQDIKDFDDFTIDDFILVDPILTDFHVQDMSKEEALLYQYRNSANRFSYEVAI